MPGGDISAATQVLNVTMEVGGKMISMPFDLLKCGVEVIQKIYAIMQIARDMKPEKGEMPIDEFYGMFGNQFTTYSVPVADASKVREIFAKNGIRFSCYPSAKADEVTFAVPLIQTQMAKDAMEAHKVESVNRSLAQHTEEFEKNFPNKLNEKLEECREQSQNANFNLDGRLVEAHLIGEYKEMLYKDGVRTIEVPRSSVTAELKDSVIVELPDGGEVELDKKGLMPRNDNYVIFVEKGKMYHFSKAETKEERNLTIDGDSLCNRYFKTMNAEKKQYFAELEERLAALDAEEKRVDAAVKPVESAQQLQNAKETDMEIVYPGIIHIDKNTLVVDEGEEIYTIRIPKYYQNHETKVREETPDGGYTFILPKQACTADGDAIIYDTKHQDSYELRDRKTAAVVATISAAQLYSNFDVVSHRHMVKMAKGAKRAAKATQKPTDNPRVAKTGKKLTI